MERSRGHQAAEQLAAKSGLGGERDSVSGTLEYRVLTDLRLHKSVREMSVPAGLHSARCEIEMLQLATRVHPISACPVRVCICSCSLRGRSLERRKKENKQKVCLPCRRIRCDGRKGRESICQSPTQPLVSILGTEYSQTKAYCSLNSHACWCWSLDSVDEMGSRPSSVRNLSRDPGANKTEGEGEGGAGADGKRLLTRTDPRSHSCLCVSVCWRKKARKDKMVTC